MRSSIRPVLKPGGMNYDNCVAKWDIVG
jgi:hypothetical protein